MLFNSFSFLLFFPLATSLYFLLRGRGRLYLLLAASACFYMAFLPKYILILCALILVDYRAGIGIEDARGPARRAWLFLSIASTCGILFLFKYLPFVSGILEELGRIAGVRLNLPHPDWLLPLGLSFHTFQSLSYVIEVYLGRQKAERDMLSYALYVMFYPQLVAGPIERPQQLLPQFRTDHVFDAARAFSGLRLMLWGFLKKCLIADRLAVLVDQVYGDPYRQGGPALALATCAFAFQIYFDFSGYSDIAIGAARVMGFRLQRNFRNPYLAASVPDFWRRWHISLSTWFRDYLYSHLGGSRGTRCRTLLNLLVVFAVSGLWHGASWTFLVWGLLNGSLLAFALLTAGLRKRLAAALGLASRPRLAQAAAIAATFALINATWVFFRAANMADALYIAVHLPRGWGDAAALAWGQGSGAHWQDVFALGRLESLLAFATAIAAIAIEASPDPGTLKSFFRSLPQWARLSAYTFALWCILLFGVISGTRFIYYAF